MENATTTKYEIKMCEECESQMVPGLYPANEFTKPENGISYIASVVPAWICPNCGVHMLVNKEESSDWLFANIQWQRSLTVTMNVSGELARIHEMGTCEECNGCDNYDDPDSDSDSDEEDTPKRTLH